jgi:hypothetical protein
VHLGCLAFNSTSWAAIAANRVSGWPFPLAQGAAIATAAVRIGSLGDKRNGPVEVAHEAHLDNDIVGRFARSRRGQGVERPVSRECGHET